MTLDYGNHLQRRVMRGLLIGLLTGVGIILLTGFVVGYFWAVTQPKKEMVYLKSQDRISDPVPAWIIFPDGWIQKWK